jgi:hypothetical protein
MIDPNLTLDKSIQKLKYCLEVRKLSHPSQQDKIILEEYMGISNDDIKREIEFFEQLRLGWIRIPNLKVDQQQILDAYNQSYFEPTGNGDYREIQGYAQVECPDFIKQQFVLPLWKSIGFLRCLPNRTIPKHKDMGRVAALLIPCKGDQSSIPLEFWDDNKNKISEVILDGPVLINTTVLHSVEKTSTEERTNFNLCFDYPLTFESVADILLRKQGIK